MSWADTVKATAFAVLAERDRTSSRMAGDAPGLWNAGDVWLARATRPRVQIAQPVMSTLTAELQRDAAQPD